jgi:serine/threonine protein kinase
MTGPAPAIDAALAGRYRIERELGAGGMATVYLAHDPRHDRPVAIKVLHRDLGATLGSERFLAEIRTTARLQHPHILPLLDSGEAGGSAPRWSHRGDELFYLDAQSNLVAARLTTTPSLVVQSTRVLFNASDFV